MAQENVVRREVHEVREATVEDAAATGTPGAAPQVVREEVVAETVVQPRQPAGGVTNVNVDKDTAGGNVNITTPDGTQVNVNT